MKFLTIIRHAKSSWEETDLEDFERPLNKRGKRDAPLIGKVISKSLPAPDIFISSPAKRAISTSRTISEEISFPSENIKVIDEIYNASFDTLLSIIRKIDNKYQNVFLCGHNPSVTELVNYLTTTKIDNMPTCAVANIKLSITSWSDISSNTGELLFFDYPKNHY